MILNTQNLTVFFTALSTKFNAAMTAVRTRVNPNDVLVEDIATLIPSTGAATVHGWLGQVKGMQEWIGDRNIKNVIAGALTVTNRDFENTISVKVKDLKDDAFGVYSPLASAMGDAAERIWLELATEALLGNGTWADGNKFFCSGRLIGEGTISNAVKTALSQTAVEAGIATMQGYTLEGGKPAQVSPRILLVGPSLEGLAKKICEADIIAEGGVGVSNVSTARRLKVLVSTDLVGDHASKWFILGEKATIKALAVQQREKPILVRMDRDTDEAVFMRGEVYYATAARGEGFLTLPFLAYMGDPNTDVTAWAAVA